EDRLGRGRTRSRGPARLGRRAGRKGGGAVAAVAPLAVMMLYPDPECPQCQGQGFIETDDGPRGCPCLEVSRRATSPEEARIPLKFRRRSLATFKITSKQHRAVLDRVLEYARNFTLESAADAAAAPD